MTIQCRTGCGEQITYEETIFPDGFIYYLPLNSDNSIHDCSNLPHDYETHLIEQGGDWEYDHPNNLDREYVHHGMDTEIEWEMYDTVTELKIKKIPEKLKKKMLITLQMRCVLFPSPFMGQYSNNPEGKEHYSDLNRLSDFYKYLGDYESAITARLIQDKITHDQTKIIIGLFNESNSTLDENHEEILKLNITALKLRDQYYRKAEQMIKSYLRKKYPKINDLQKDFPLLFLSADKLRANPSKHIKHEYDDVIEFLSFGASVKIMRENRTNRKDWKEIDWDIIKYASFVVDRRNDMEHYSDDQLEESISKETKTLGYVFSKQIIDFFKNLDYI